MTQLEKRLKVAIRKETGIRLSPLEAKQLARMIGVDDSPSRRSKKPKPASRSKCEPVSVHIRWMIRRDMEEVMAIDASVGLEWDEQDFIRCLRQRNCIGMVAEIDEKVVGHMIYELHKSRLHVLNFGVAAESQARTIGTQMIDKLKGKLSKERRNRITFEIDETNIGAQLFLSRLGFFASEVDEGDYKFVFRFGGKKTRFKKRAGKRKTTQWRDSDGEDDDWIFT